MTDRLKMDEDLKPHVWQDLHNLAYLMNNENHHFRQRKLQETLAKFSKFDLSNEWELSVVRDLLSSWAEGPRENHHDEAEYQRGFVSGSWFADNTPAPEDRAAIANDLKNETFKRGFNDAKEYMQLCNYGEL
jgi:hypothetical protein